jgi:hypothetical protein
MCCEEREQQLGRYVDGELPAPRRAEVEAHLSRCPSCRHELEELGALAAGLAESAPVAVPPTLWERIEERLGQAAPSIEQPPAPSIGEPPAPSIGQPPAPPIPLRRPGRRIRLRPAHWALAAAVVLALGLGLFGISTLEPTAHASTVDFGALLDGLPLDARGAFDRFLARYDARPTTPAAAGRIAPHLNFATPEFLPGGFRRTSVHQIRIGKVIGIAAAYDRDGEFLAAVFHPPMNHENYGAHEGYPCVIGEHCGHKVQVGEWKLVHLTDPSTCHCLLSRLDEQSEIPAVMSAIAFANTASTTPE